MAVINNTASEVGDVILISSDYPIVGLSSITSYTEGVLNETATRKFKREFRYSLDGINYSTYIDLSNVNLSAIPIDPKFDFFIEYKYTREGSDTTGILVLENVDILGTYSPYITDIVFDKSVFKKFFSSCKDERILKWSINVLNKIYKPGILSSTLTRGVNQNMNEEDRDFIDFWRSVTSFMGMHVAYAREFENIISNRELMIKYLRGRGMYVCENQSLSDLNHLMSNYWDEMRHRGTQMIAKKKGDVVNGTSKPIDGELLRLLCYNNSCDEFILGISESSRFGWVMGQWSPMYKGTTDQVQLNKIYETSRNVTDLSLWPLINSGDVSIVNDTVPDPNIGTAVGVMEIDAPSSGQKSGIGFATPDFSKSTNIDSSLTYELSFYVKVVSGSPLFSVRMYGYDVGNVLKDLGDIKSSVVMPASNDMIVEAGLPTSNDWYHVKCYLYPSDHSYVNDSDIHTPQIGVGNNLKSTTNVCKIIPEVVLDNTNGSATGSIRIWNFRFSPAKTDYSTGFMNTSNFVQTWIKPNDASKTNQELENVMKEYLLPYRIFLKNNIL